MEKDNSKYGTERNGSIDFHEFVSAFYSIIKQTHHVCHPNNDDDTCGGIGEVRIGECFE